MGRYVLYMLKTLGLKLHPCLTPRPCGKICVFWDDFNRLFVYMGFIMLYVFPPTPLSINLYGRPHANIVKSFFWNQQGMRRLCFGLFLCQFECAGWIRGLSYANFTFAQYIVWGNVRGSNLSPLLSIGVISPRFQVLGKMPELRMMLKSLNIAKWNLLSV